jgi:hypothetical protein
VGEARYAYPDKVKRLMTRPHHLSCGKYTNETVERMTLVAKRLYLQVKYGQFYVCARWGGSMGNARVCEKARGGHPPNSQIPGVEIELIAQLLAVLSFIGMLCQQLSATRKKRRAGWGGLPGCLVAGALSCHAPDSRGFLSFRGGDTCRPPQS